MENAEKKSVNPDSPAIRDITNFRPIGWAKIGRINLPLVDHPHTHFVPASQNIVNHEETIEALAVAVKERLPVMLVGQTGTGKTTLVKELASRTKNALVRINLNGNTTVDEFVGRWLINKDGTVFVDGILTNAMRNGHWLLLDELNASLPEVLLVLQSVLEDNDGKLTLVEKDGEVVKPHPAFRLFATMNPSEGYVGTKELNPATLSRFFMAIEVPFPDEETELKIIKSKLPELPKTAESELREMVKLAHDIRVGYSQGEYRYLMSTRDLIYWARANEHYGDLVKSAKYCILGKCNRDDSSAIGSILKVYFGTSTEVTEKDGTLGGKYKKGNVFQACDNKLACERQGSREQFVFASGTTFEVVEIRGGRTLARMLRGKAYAPNTSRDKDGNYVQDLSQQIELPHTEVVNISNVEMCSTRRVDVVENVRKK